MLHIFNLAYGMEQGREIRKVGFPQFLQSTNSLFTAGASLIQVRLPS
jgi:hypothetical protein